jgi:TolB-like protein/Tfp pilus assembly protein PilF
MSRLKRLIQEIHRRSLWQVLGIYLVGAWVAFQGIEALVSGLGLPEWVPGLAVVILIAGLPIVLATAFVREGAGEEETSGEAETGNGVRRLWIALVTTAGVVVLLAIAAWVTWPRPLGLLIDFAGIGSLPAEPGLPEKPSIVVLPFENLSGDPAQEYFSDGITEDLIHELARRPFLFVIARNSAFSYKGKHVNVEDVGRELGVRYVVEGSVRKAEGRVRITAQLIDATTGGHLWSERYDRDLSDIFALQSEIAEEILAAVSGEIFRAEEHRLARRPTTSLSAWEAGMQGEFHMQRFTVEDNEKARAFFARALELDPELAPAHAGLGNSYWIEYANGWNHDPALLDRAEELGRRAITLDPMYFQGYMTVGWVEFARGNLSEALAASERAIELAPNFEFPHALRGMVLARQGRLVEATGSIRRALRLNPRAPFPGILTSVAYVNLAAGRRQEAVEFLERARATAPGNVTLRVALAALYEEEGAHEKAQAAVAEILHLRPDLSAEAAMELILGLDQIVSAEELAQYPVHLRKAGLPE